MLRTVAAPLLLALSLTACGGSDGSSAPTDASKEDFCKAYNAEPEFDDSLGDASTEEQADAIKKALDQVADDFEDVGTPKGIPDDAREGFEISLEAVNDISKADVEKALEDQDGDFLDGDLDGDDKKKADAFKEWSDDYCG